MNTTRLRERGARLELACEEQFPTTLELGGPALLCPACLWVVGGCRPAATRGGALAATLGSVPRLQASVPRARICGRRPDGVWVRDLCREISPRLFCR